MNNSPLYFAQVPHFAIANLKLTHLQFRIYSLLEFYRFKNESEITSTKISEILNMHRDTVRRELNNIKNVLADHISIHFLKSKLKFEPDQIIVHFKYLNTEINIDRFSSENNFTYSDRKDIESVLLKSKYFKTFKADEIFSITNAENKNELIKAIIYTDALKKEIENPKAYLRSCFKAGIFKYDKAIINLTELKIKGKINSTIKIDSPYFFGLTFDEFENLKHKKSDNYKFRFFTDSIQKIIYAATYKTKPANIKNSLERFNIKYTIYRREN